MGMPERRRSLVVPREHGAWGILLVPLTVGAWAGLVDGGSFARVVPLIVAALALFWMRTPLESWAGASPIKARTADEFALVGRALWVLGAVAAAALMGVFWGGERLGLFAVGAAAGAAFAAQWVVKRAWRGARTAAQIIGSAGLTATAPAAYYAATGHFAVTAWQLWAASFAFAANQIHFVQVRVHAAKATTRRAKMAAGWVFFAGQSAMVVILIAACALRLFPWGGSLAFVPILIRGFAWFATPGDALVIRELGKSELAFAIGFGLLLGLLV